jgi:hypothetical protein
MANPKANGPPDLGRSASVGFQSGPRTASRPYERERYTTVDPGRLNGGGFQNTVKRDDERQPVAGNSEQKDEATND